MSATAADLLVPTPHSLLGLEGSWCSSPGRPLAVWLEGSADLRALALLERGLGPERVEHGSSAGQADIVLAVDPAAGLRPQGYRLRVGPDGVRIVAADDAGAFYAVGTLLQLTDPECATRRDAVPLQMRALEIVDAPDFARRGVMLDVSRDRVPRMETLYALVERLSRWKLNELQLYTEHTFAYREHGGVWGRSSPLQPGELRDLAHFCAQRHVDLVPNQQSLGHFHRWLVHDRYRDLAECPDGVEHPFATRPEPFSLAPARPETLAFVRELHDELLESFQSPFLNVGLDETFDIGMGASRAAVEAHGKGRVYLDYLCALERTIAERGLRMQFWGDVILEHPELVADLPRDAIALAWGYEAGHPFVEQTRRFAEAGLEFYVCPGTSTWLSLAGRRTNARANLEAAALAGRDTGALGYLITDWGDFGHWQPEPASYAPLLAGASRAWNAAGALVDLAQGLDRHAFGRAAGGSLGAIWVAMAELYRESGATSINGSPLFFLLRFAHEGWPHPRIGGLTHAGLARVRGRVEDLRGDLARAVPAGDERALVQREARWVLDALAFACDLGVARLDLGEGPPLSALEATTRARLRDAWNEVCAGLRPLWLARSRPGGLEDSIGRFRLLEQLAG